MKKQKSLILFVATSFVLSSFMAFAGGVKLTSGKLDVLKNEKTLKITFVYENMRIGKNLTEKEYVDQKVAEGNSKEPGKGDKWKSSWVNARIDKYQPHFEELFNKESEGRKVSENAPDAKYILIVKTVYIEPGYNIGISKKPSYVSFIFQVAETTDPTKVLAEMSSEEVRGTDVMGFDYDASTRLAESYAKAGKMLGNFFSDKIK